MLPTNCAARVQINACCLAQRLISNYCTVQADQHPQQESGMIILEAAGKRVLQARHMHKAVCEGEDELQG